MQTPSGTADKPYPEFIAFVDALPPSLRILDLGCGSGRNARHLASCGHRVVALDIDPKCLAELGKLTADEALPIQLIEADMTATDWRKGIGLFDLILLDRALHYITDLPDQMHFLHAMEKLVAPVGILFLIVVSVTDVPAFTPEHYSTIYSGPMTHSVAGAGCFKFHATAWRRTGNPQQELQPRLETQSQTN